MPKKWPKIQPTQSNLSNLIHLYRITNKLSLRKAAEKMGLHYKQIERLESGGDLSFDAFATLVQWLRQGVSLTHAEEYEKIKSEFEERNPV